MTHQRIECLFTDTDTTFDPVSRDYLDNKETEIVKTELDILGDSLVIKVFANDNRGTEIARLEYKAHEVEEFLHKS